LVGARSRGLSGAVEALCCSGFNAGGYDWIGLAHECHGCPPLDRWF
jgi:hypothetical protein